jgi:hypothetical protein
MKQPGIIAPKPLVTLDPGEIKALAGIAEACREASYSMGGKIEFDVIVHVTNATLTFDSAGRMKVTERGQK